MGQKGVWAKSKEKEKGPVTGVRETTMEDLVQIKHRASQL